MEKKITITEDDFAKAVAKATRNHMDKLEQTAKKHGMESPGFTEALSNLAFSMELSHVLFGEENRDE